MRFIKYYWRWHKIWLKDKFKVWHNLPPKLKVLEMTVRRSVQSDGQSSIYGHIYKTHRSQNKAWLTMAEFALVFHILRRLINWTGSKMVVVMPNVTTSKMDHLRNKLNYDRISKCIEVKAPRNWKCIQTNGYVAAVCIKWHWSLITSEPP